MAISFPQDVLLFHILPRLPIKSTSRFMCVSKQLYSFLSSDMFKKMQNRYLDRHQDKFLFVYGTSPHMFGTFDCEAPDSGLVPSSFRLPFDAEAKRIEFLTSFHGLVCVGIFMNHTNYEYSDLILWNPLTSDYKTLSKTNSHMSCYDRYWGTSGLFYSSCEDDYKLVRLQSLNVYIYSLKSDSWRRVNSLQGNLNLDGGKRSIWLNGKLYFKSYAQTNSVTRFDTNTEKFEEIEASFVVDKFATIMVQSGCLHFFIMIYNGRTRVKEPCIQLWKMIKDGCWNKVVTYHADPYGIRNLTPLHFMRNDKLLMLDKVDRALYEVDLKKKKLSKENNLVSMGISDQVRYTETFVSSNLNLGTHLGTQTSQCSLLDQRYPCLLIK